MPNPNTFPRRASAVDIEPPVVEALRDFSLVYHGPLTFELNRRAMTFDLSRPH